MSQINIPLFKVFMAPREALMPRLEEVLYSGQISEGEPVSAFEKAFGAFAGHPNMLSFYSGTAALHAAFHLAGVRTGDDVVSTPMTAEPTNMAIRHAGGNIVWADVDPGNGNLTAASIEATLTPRTRAVCVVHYGGIPCDMAPIRKLAAERGIAVIEDAAHALGARYGNAPVGKGSDFTMFSLQAIKHMTTVDGGMLACADPTKLPEGRRFRWFGIDRHAPRVEVEVREVGWKYHMNNVTAAIGDVQLKFIQPVIDRHIENGRWFDDNLRNIAGITLCTIPETAEPSYWFYTVLAEDRAGLARYLEAHGIGNSQAHRRNDEHPVFASSRRALPGVDSYYSRMLHIPCGWWVSDESREYIAEVLRKGW